MTPSASALERPHLLIVSDDDDLREFLESGLVYAGFWVSAIASGLQTLEVLRLRQFDLIIIDATVGDFPALEIVRRLRGWSSRSGSLDAGSIRADVPVLIIAAAGEIDESDALTAGADGVLSPPFELDDLARQFHHVVLTWRRAHPDRPWADAASSSPRESRQ